MNEAQLHAKLDELLGLPAESEWVEFKKAESSFHFDDIGQRSVDYDPWSKSIELGAECVVGGWCNSVKHHVQR